VWITDDAMRRRPFGDAPQEEFKMMKRFAIALAAVAMCTMTGCAHFGTAKLPDRAEFFVTTGDLSAKDYQPVALVQSESQICTPCGLTLEGAYEKLEASLKDDVIAKAKALGANGIINMSYRVIPIPGMSMITVTGLAVKM
jgi:hypothetical protein